MTFALMRILDIFIFVLLPLLLILITFFNKKLSKKIRTLIIASISILIIFGIYSHYIEPYWFKTTTYEISSDLISRDYRIVFLSDIQTDEIRNYEKRVFEEVNMLNPDIVLFGGDYLTSPSATDIVELQGLLDRLNPEFGIYAVRGNIDSEEIMDEIFINTDVIRIPSRIVINEELNLNLFSLEESFGIDTLEIMENEMFSIVLGHAPDYSLEDINAQLLLAGHTHGGQVQLPFYGPLMTFSTVPHDWAYNETQIDEDTLLVVSNGIGMERGVSPELRFLARPEIIVIELVSVH